MKRQISTDQVDFKINVEYRKYGTVVIQIENVSERERIKQEIENKMSESYVLKVPNKIQMSITVTDMNIKYEDNRKS